MISVNRSTIIDAPVDQVWAVVRDFNGHDDWHPAVARSEIEDGRRSDAIGAVRNFVLESGEHVRERLLSYSEKDHMFRYAIVEADIPLRNYVAEMVLKPVTDGDMTYWSWQSRFETPVGREQEFAALVAAAIYEAGFEAVRQRVTRSQNLPGQSVEAIPAMSSSGIAVIVDKTGGPDQLRLTQINAPPPGPGQVRLRQTAIGVNFIDVHCRTGYFDLLELPGIPGLEAAGVITDTGPGVDHLHVGQRVAYACLPPGAYTSVRTMDASTLVLLPDHIDDRTAAAGLLKGMTAEFLLHRVHEIKPGETILVYAPAGGVGRLLCQWAHRLGATVIGASSSPEKADDALAAGADHVVVPGNESLEEQVRRLTGGNGVDVVYDGIGRDSFEHSVAALAPCGHLVSFGEASGPIPPIDINALVAVSATVSRPNFAHYADRPDKIAAMASRLFDALKDQIVSLDDVKTWPLAEAAAAHRALESRETTGSIVLIPDGGVQ